jgi:hypothetical protein
VVSPPSLTTVAEFLDGDVLRKFSEKPEGWQSSGKPVKP